jgi:hypothetical protein
MGLAASQSRFLAVTARKNACEFRSMGIAQEKLSLTRDLQRATEQHNEKMNATKLIWNMDGSGGYDGIEQDLTYDIMMSASAFNDYLPYLVTDKRGQTVLNTRLANAAMMAGIEDRGGTSPNVAGRNKFLEALIDQGIIPKSISEKITEKDKVGTANDPTIADPNYELGSKFYSNIGVGGFPMDKTKAFNMNLDQMTLYFDQVIEDSQMSEAEAKSNGLNIEQLNKLKELANLLQFNIGVSAGTTEGADKENILDTATVDPNGSKSLYVNGTSVQGGTYTLTDLLTKDIVYVTDFQTINNESAMEAFVIQLKTTLEQVFVKDTNIEATNAFDYAYGQVMNKLLTSTENVSRGGSANDAKGKAESAAKTYNTWVKSTYMDYSGGSITTGTRYAVSLSNITESFMTYFAQAMGGFGESGYGIDKTVAKSVYVTDDPSFSYTVNNKYNEDAYDMKTLFYADFYNALYNNLCRNGWTTTTQDLSDPQYLHNALKNGQLFISSLNDEGYYYQGEYTRNGHVVEITDEDAIARATAEYTMIKSKLNYKEEVLEIDMKNLDMEIAALSAEYDSVKGIISKNTEKAFSLFQ